MKGLYNVIIPAHVLIHKFLQVPKIQKIHHVGFEAIHFPEARVENFR